MLEIVGFEGYAGSDVLLTFGAAAFRGGELNDRLWNGVTWWESDFSSFAEHVQNGAVTSCRPQKLPLNPEPLKEEHVACLVLRCSRRSPALDIIRAWLVSSARYLYAWGDETWAYWLVTPDVLKPLGAYVLASAAPPCWDSPDRDAIKKHAYVLDHELDPVFQSMAARGSQKKPRKGKGT